MLKKFTTKKDKHAYVKSVIYKLKCGYIMPEDSDFSLFQELVSGRIENVIYFSIVPNRINTTSFECQAHLLSGDIKVFSWNKCVMNRVETDYSRTRSLMRSLIVSQILEFKKDAICCVSCGSVDYLQADHIKPFRDLCSEFLLLGKDISCWRSYHKNNASLQILCAKCNFKKH